MGPAQCTRGIRRTVHDSPRSRFHTQQVEAELIPQHRQHLNPDSMLGLGTRLGLMNHIRLGVASVLLW